ncbi:MAG: isoprenylcysteine carboxylmethyltransferase family protein [Chloroflexota bacterium]
MEENVWSHFGQWWAMILWIIVFGLFLLFIPFYRKSQRKPASVYLAFIVALAFEMFGVPLTMYAISWAIGTNLPEGVLWGHTLVQHVGLAGTYAMGVLTVAGALLIILGWRQIYKDYWSKEEGKGRLVTSGIYNYIRHPQYTGFLLITFGMLLEWATLPMLIMWPLLLTLYYRLARKEEAMMVEEFGQAYRDYQHRTGMFLPRVFGRGTQKPSKYLA